jgi:D-sedoheptulose 7-phosphate isomerase
MRKDLLRTDVNVYFDNLARVIARMPIQPIDQLVSVLLQAYESGRMIYLFGNGGSAALASHLACDLGKGTVNGSPKRFRALALTDSVPLMTAWANDSEYNNIFSEQLLNFVQPEDVAFAISGSGNSANVLNALEVARRAGAFTLGLTGFGGSVGQYADHRGPASLCSSLAFHGNPAKIDQAGIRRCGRFARRSRSETRRD